MYWEENYYVFFNWTELDKDYTTAGIIEASMSKADNCIF
jgi:hypothetical protein